MDKISVIIPVYNAERTIRRCLESISSSGYLEYEVILIDDGSIDNSTSIISEYVHRDCRFKMFSQSNSGPSSARNKGLELANGEIIAFVDSDDYVHSNYLQQLAETFEGEKADVVFFEFCRVTPDGMVISNHHLPPIREDYYENLVALSEEDMFGYTWIKAYRRDILQGILFDTDINLFEDEIFTTQALKRPVRISYIKNPIYYYVRTTGTLAEKTHPEYCYLCDKVFRSWKMLLQGTLDRNAYLRNKANHMAKVCKYYGLERKVRPFLFYPAMRNTVFMQYCTSNDPFIVAIKKRKWWKVMWMHLKYKAKVAIAKHVNRKVNR